MGRQTGSWGRDLRDSVRYLKKWLRAVRMAIAKRGCSSCEEPFYTLGSMTFHHEHWVGESFQVSKGPGMRGMTLQRLKEEVRLCTPLCRKCLALVGRIPRCGANGEDQRIQGVVNEDVLDLDMCGALDEIDQDSNPKVIFLNERKYYRETLRVGGIPIVLGVV